ncbi:two component, sigma54 specific, transcriptional regulator, Fis family [Geoalkalibacter ferrihydriticus]|uniref:Fis family transcriptional regulator n=2 Tax=Geoalkalibacter ferrihydriticus TaxID=392333 RepID=A0A0C2EEB2_9BACT|nr:sigma-54 dependent transcriptional regulator [Geoalkalibacter ferrihydriticus]KIH76953.1 Fis family transcriptional regulator [Geoalkalibacter ferrihydriticus DSM 17813]SDL42787.1 two component, sigma54 specific, transcriptional regulator, Fis family [Geoalkalibacter ferrihydriticus]
MKNTTQVLVIDDEAHNRQALSMLLKHSGYQVQSAVSGEDALEIMQETPFEIIITDLFLPGVSGIDILKRVKEDSPYTSVILITGNASAETAVEAMKEGAFDYITKPFNFEKLKVIVAKAVEKSRLVAENLYLRQQLRGKYKFDNIIGNSLAMNQVFSRMERIVNTDSTILILGESGTGKELVAKAIHYNSPRKDHPFIAINCGAIPAELLESELFGHVRGSFTGAVGDKAGRFEAANGGTIFLDEIGTMPMHLQMKLLRVLQEQEVERVGSTRKTKLNVRVVSATNANLEDEVKRGHFREDLYYRLNVIPIILPPLRERREDIALLARSFLQKFCREMDRPLMSISPAAMAAIEAYAWPGNVRELENLIERTVALTDGEVIEPDDLPASIAGANPPSPYATPEAPRVTPTGVDMVRVISDIERAMICESLELTKGVKARAAALLGINRTTLVEKIKRLGLEER